MPSGRMEAFSDAVIAILITIMVLELHVPEGTSWGALGESVPTLFAYLLSFVYLGIYWNNHHHMLMVTERVGTPRRSASPSWRRGSRSRSTYWSP